MFVNGLPWPGHPLYRPALGLGGGRAAGCEARDVSVRARRAAAAGLQHLHREMGRWRWNCCEEGAAGTARTARGLVEQETVSTRTA